MKIRTDFVTNSSSSSFIISTDKEVPKNYEHILHRITKENLVEQIKDIEHFDNDDYFGYEMSYEDIQKLGQFTDEQLLMVYLIREEKFSAYLDLKKALEENDTPVYYVSVGDSYLYDNPELRDFIFDAQLIEEERD